MAGTTKVVFDGLFNSQNIKNVRRKLFDNINASAKRELKDGFKTMIKPKFEAQMKSNFKIKKVAFTRAFGKVIYSKKTHELASMSVYAKLSYIMDGFVSGNTIRSKSGYLLIPLIRMKRKELWRKLLSDLQKENSLVYKRKGNKILLLATVTKENSNSLRGFKNLERFTRNKQAIKNGTGTVGKGKGYKGYKVKRGTTVILGVMQKQVTLRKRFSMAPTLKQVSHDIAVMTLTGTKKLT